MAKVKEQGTISSTLLLLLLLLLWGHILPNPKDGLVEPKHIFRASSLGEDSFSFLTRHLTDRLQVWRVTWLCIKFSSNLMTLGNLCLILSKLLEVYPHVIWSGLERFDKWGSKYKRKKYKGCLHKKKKIMENSAIHDAQFRRETLEVYYCNLLSTHGWKFDAT